MKASELNLREQLHFDPERGRITFGSHRMVLVETELMGSIVDAMIEVGDTIMAKRCSTGVGIQLGIALRESFEMSFSPKTSRNGWH